ncbi:MAG: hypothetical protein AAF349_02010 [Cyanobacteria bacterium P01_A01_bin.68]
MAKESRNPRIYVTLPKGYNQDLSDYAEDKGWSVAAAAAYLLQRQLDTLKEEGQLVTDPTGRFIEALASGTVDFRKLGEALKASPEYLEALCGKLHNPPSYVKDCKEECNK